MWKKLYETLASLFMLTQRVERIEKQNEEMRREIHDLQLAMQRLAHEIARTNEREAQERKNLSLQLELALVRFEQRLPSAPKGE